MADPSVSTGYESQTRVAIPQFSGEAHEWSRWKTRFLIYMEEMDLKDSLTKSGGDKKKAAKAFRILFLSCRGQAEDLLHTRIDDTTD
ncbi:MAG: hypothetical protein ACK559_24625, partial [bacterium]